MWWLTDREDQRAVAPDVEAVEAHVSGQLGPAGSLLIVEGLIGWQAVPGRRRPWRGCSGWMPLSAKRDIDVVLPVDPLSLSVHFGEDSPVSRPFWNSP